MVDKILKAIEDTYKKKFVGLVKVNETDSGYKVDLGLNDNRHLLVSITADIKDEDDFIKFFIEELRNRRLHDSNYFTEVRYNSDPGQYYRTDPSILK